MDASLSCWIHDRWRRIVRIHHLILDEDDELVEAEAEVVQNSRPIIKSQIWQMVRGQKKYRMKRTKG